MLQLYPNKEQLQKDLEVRERLQRTFAKLTKPKEDLSKRLEETHFVIGCILKEMVGNNFSEDFLTHIVWIKSGIPKWKVEEVLQKSKKVYDETITS